MFVRLERRRRRRARTQKGKAVRLFSHGLSADPCVCVYHFVENDIGRQSFLQKNLYIYHLFFFFLLVFSCLIVFFIFFFSNFSHLCLCPKQNGVYTYFFLSCLWEKQRNPELVVIISCWLPMANKEKRKETDTIEEKHDLFGIFFLFKNICLYVTHVDYVDSAPACLNRFLCAYLFL